MGQRVTAKYRISRFHDEKGNFVDGAGLLNAVPAFATAAAKRLFNYRPPVPMISYRGRRVIEGLLTPESRMVEFGSGNSTLWFAARAGSVLSIEDDDHWYRHVQKQCADRGISNVRHELRTAETYADMSDVADASLDFALVDGTDRAGCIHSVVNKLKPGGWLYLDNSDKDMTLPDGDVRRAEQALLDAVQQRQGQLRYFSDFSPTNFFVEQGLLARL
ncbi:MAG: class I SAM-dependent methyltransferase [Rhodospirillales bacterium]|nr:class I SAM-dependent methyltransferase [Rhodospirillales bacterium]